MCLPSFESVGLRLLLFFFCQPELEGRIIDHVFSAIIEDQRREKRMKRKDNNLLDTSELKQAYAL